MSNQHRKRNANLVVVILAIVLAGFFVCCGVAVVIMAPLIQHAREVERRERAASNLRQLDQALKSYHQANPIPPKNGIEPDPARPLGVQNDGDEDME